MLCVCMCIKKNQLIQKFIADKSGELEHQTRISKSQLFNMLPIPFHNYNQ